MLPYDIIYSILGYCSNLSTLTKIPELYHIVEYYINQSKFAKYLKLITDLKKLDKYQVYDLTDLSCENNQIIQALMI